MDNPCREVANYYTLGRRLDHAVRRLINLGRSATQINEIWSRWDEFAAQRFHMPIHIEAVEEPSDESLPAR